MPRIDVDALALLLLLLLNEDDAGPAQTSTSDEDDAGPVLTSISACCPVKYESHLNADSICSHRRCRTESRISIEAAS